MVFYTYATISEKKTPLPPHIDAYLVSSPPKSRQARHAVLSLLSSLAQSANLPLDFPIRVTPFGKPFFDSPNAPHFNLSHSGDIVAVALGNTPVGIDVQEWSDSLQLHRLALRYFSKNEQQDFLCSPNSKRSFFELWTKKEALGKYLGEGLLPTLGNDTDALAKTYAVRFETLHFLQNGKSYTLSVCSKELPQKISISDSTQKRAVAFTHSP